MKKTELKIKKTIKVKVIATAKEVKIRFPKQVVGQLALDFNGKIIRQWSLVLNGDRLTAERTA